MTITITKTIQEMLDCCPLDKHQEILTHAWEACCDGEYLKECSIEEDLWNGNNEQDRIVFERSVVREIIFMNSYYTDEDSYQEFVAIEY